MTTPTEQGAPRTLVLGIGNILWADEGFGVRCVEELHAGWRMPPEVRLMDGGTQGLYLLHHVEEAEALLVFDAVDWGLAPGTLKVVRGEEVPAFLGVRKMSLHQTGFQEVLATAELRGWRPCDVVLVGVQPQQLEDFGGGLTAPVAAAIPGALEVALEILRGWGHAPQRREAAPDQGLAAAPVSRASYEGGRPAEHEACRHGDARFLNLLAGQGEDG